MSRRAHLRETVLRWTTAALPVVASAVAGVAGCRDATSPAVRQVVGIGNINVSPHAAPLDTIWISFFLAAQPCDTGTVVATEYTSTGVRYTASSVHTGGVCPLAPGSGAVAYLPHVFVIVPPHLTPFVARFAEPGGADSVRTIGP